MQMVATKSFIRKPCDAKRKLGMIGALLAILLCCVLIYVESFPDLGFRQSGIDHSIGCCIGIGILNTWISTYLLQRFLNLRTDDLY
jgi:hypothetical protein